MAKLIDIDWDPNRAKLRQFGWVGWFVFAALALAAWYGRGPFATELGAARAPLLAALVALSALCAVFARFWPRGNRPLYLVLTALAWPIGLVLSHVILLALFFGVITPIGLLLRVLGKDPLSRAADPTAQSYWRDVERKRSRSGYFRQF